MAFLLTMPGVPFLYYGDEIGLRSLAGLPSKEGGYGRTGARTPMQWDDSPNAGFSSATDAAKLYLPIDPRADRPTVAAARINAGSSLHAVKALIALRHGQPALQASGDFREIVASSDQPLFVFEPSKGTSRLLLAINPAGSAAEVKLPASVNAKSVKLLAGGGGAFRRQGENWNVRLEGASYAVVAVE